MESESFPESNGQAACIQVDQQLRGDGQANWVDGLRMDLGTEGGNVTMTALSWQLFRDRDKDEEDN